MVPAATPYAPHWALYPLHYEALPVTEPITIDGNHEKPVWRKAPWSEPFGDIQGQDAPSSAVAAPLTRFKALYDSDFLYICAMLHPSEKFATETHFTDRNSPIFQKDSDFEVFVDPFLSNHNYKEFEVNAINTVWNLMLDKPYDDGGREHSGRVANPEEDDYYEVAKQESSVRILSGTINDRNHPATWIVELKMAFSDLLVEAESGTSTSTSTPNPGTLWRINFSRVEAQGEVNWTWQPQLVWNPPNGRFEGKVAMHLPDAWGYLTFASELETSNRSGRDEQWPAKVGAMHVYYAQHEYKRRTGSFTTHMTNLKDLVDDDIVAPLEISIVGSPASFSVQVRMQGSAQTVVVRDDRLMSYH